jgi:HEAT repeat protein
MSFRTIGLIVLIVLSLATAVLLVASRESSDPDEQEAASEEPVSPPTSPQPGTGAPATPLAQPPVAVNPDAPDEGIQSPEAMSPEDLEDDAQIEQEQVNAALAQLSSAETAQRIEGAEQLGAYPTKEAEAALLQALGSDSEPEVRSAAAQSLGYVEKPTDGTINGLVAALEDQNEDVRLNALSTLEDFLLGSEETSKRYKKILSSLKSKGDARSVPQDTRDAIRDILQDLSGTPAQ